MIILIFINNTDDDGDDNNNIIFIIIYIYIFKSKMVVRSIFKKRSAYWVMTKLLTNPKLVSTWSPRRLRNKKDHFSEVF